MSIEKLVLAPGEHGAVIGMTGTGKSFLSRHLLPKKGPLGIIDPKRTFSAKIPDIKIYDNPKSLLRDKPSRFSYRPKPDLLDDMAAYNDVYKYCYDRGNMLVYTDDVVGIMDRSTFPRYFRICYQMGREVGISMLSAFQRPAWVPIFMMSEASRFYVFNLTMETDEKKVSSFIKGYNPNSLPDKHSFIYRHIHDKNKPPTITRLREG